MIERSRRRRIHYEIPTDTEILDQNPNLLRLKSICLIILNDLTTSQSLKGQFNLDKNLVKQAQDIVTQCGGFGVGISHQNSKILGQNMLIIYKNIVLEEVQRLSSELSAFQSDASIIEFFYMLDEKSQVFRYSIYILNIIFSKLDCYIQNAAEYSATTVAYRIYKVKFLEQKIGNKNNLWVDMVSNLLITSRIEMTIPQIKLKQFFTDLNVLECKDIKLELNIYTREIILNSHYIDYYYYKRIFEETHLKKLFDVYVLEANKLIDLPLLQYVNQVERIFSFEEKFCEAIYPQSWNEIKQELSYIFVARYVPYLDSQQTAIRGLFDQSSFEDLQQVVQFCQLYPSKFEAVDPRDERQQMKEQWTKSKINCISIILREFYSYVFDCGNSIPLVEQTPENRPFYFTEQMINIQRRVDQIDNFVFKGMGFKQYSKAFKALFDQNDSACQFINIYFDRQMRDKRLSDSYLHELITIVTRFFTYMTNKDIFIEELRKRLSHRLITGTSIIDLERLILCQIEKQIQSKQAIQNLYEMIKDVQSSIQVTSGFHIPNINFKAIIINADHWPIIIHDFKKKGLDTLTDQVRDQLNNHYQKHYQDRFIDQLITEDICEVHFTSVDKYILLMNSAQMMVLMSFNKSMRISIQSLIQTLGFNLEFLEKFLAPLVANRIIIREKQVNDEYINEEFLELNVEFRSPRKRLAVFPSKKQQSVNLLEQGIDIKKERDFRIRSIIVRLLKQRKTMQHSELIQEVHKHVDMFKTSVSDIKPQIDYLIQENYISRDLHQIDIYTYMS